MTLITYVDDRNRVRVWKMPLYVTVIGDIDDYLQSDSTSGVLIVHGGQADAQLPWADGLTELVAAVAKACRNGRAIIFSGGFPMVSPETLRRQLAELKLREGEHYLLLTAIINLFDEIDFPLLERLRVMAPDWRIGEAKLRHAVPTLLTLGYLCQASLLAFAPDMIDQDAIELLGGRKVIDEIHSASSMETRERMHAIGIWRGALGFQELMPLREAIEREWPASVDRRRGVDALLDVVYENTGPLPQGVLAEAFAEVSEALRCNEEAQQ